MNILQKNWQDLIKPTKLEIQTGRDRSRTATVVAEPLERGFGMTLGNALRRVLLSSLQGAAIKTVQIDGVLHEFSSVPGVREDVTDIILNLKEIALRIHSEGVKRMVLKKEGAGPVTAGDIEASSEVEVLNPDHVICHLDQGAFTIYKGGALAIDSGLYGPSYDADHHMDYQYQTIAHNTVTVTDPADTVPAPAHGNRPPRPIANDGGQRRVGSGWGVEAAPLDLDEWRRTRSGFFRESLSHYRQCQL